MRYGLSVPPFTDPARVVRWGVEAEAAGWDGVFLWDHLRWREAVDPDVHDPFVLLGAIAARTERVVLGPLVTPLARRRPAVLTKQVLTLDHLTGGGRVVLGVGLGDPPDRDFSDWGDEPDPRVRAAMLDEHLAVLDGLLRGHRVDHDGEHYAVHASVRPGPVTRPRPPVWVAGVVPNRRPLTRARRWDGVVPVGEGVTPDVLRAYLDGDAPDGWEVVVEPSAGGTPQEWADAGATWLVESVWPTEDGWADRFEQRVRSGPPR